MPEPMIRPMTRASPLRKVKLLCFSKLPPLRACVGSSPVPDGAPIAVYPLAVVVESGKRFEAKSKADETEYVRSRASGRGRRAASPSSWSGSSSEKDNLREDGAPDAEDSRESLCDASLEDAREASSSESR